MSSHLCSAPSNTKDVPSRILDIKSTVVEKWMIRPALDAPLRVSAANPLQKMAAVATFPVIDFERNLDIQPTATQKTRRCPHSDLIAKSQICANSCVNCITSRSSITTAHHQVGRRISAELEFKRLLFNIRLALPLLDYPTPDPSLTNDLAGTPHPPHIVEEEAQERQDIDDIPWSH
jgi:hypothetical protein